jgi:hypothetical protein
VYQYVLEEEYLKNFLKSENSKIKRNILVTLDVTETIIASPITAGLAVGIGVPILLVYVYGVRIRFLLSCFFD